MVMDFPQIPIARSGILKIPSGSTPCPRGFSKSPPGSGDLGENPLPKTRISYINIFLLKEKKKIMLAWSMISGKKRFTFVELFYFSI